MEPRVSVLVLIAALLLLPEWQQVGSGSVQGTLIDADSREPIRNAEVRLQRCFPDPSDVGSLVQQLVRTDERGRFRFERLPACTFTLAAFVPGYLNGQYGQRRPGTGPGQRVVIGPGQQLDNIEFRIARGGAIGGQVRGPLDEPLPFARVQALRTFDAERRPDAVAEVNADELGRYRIFGLVPGDYVVRAVARPDAFPSPPLGPARTAPSAARAVEPCGGPKLDKEIASAYYPGSTMFASAARIAVTTGQDHTGADVRIPPVDHVAVGGTVNNSSGVVPPGLRVLLLDSGVCLAAARVGTNGQFALGRIPHGHYQLQVVEVDLWPASTADAQAAASANRRGWWAAESVLVSGTEPIDTRVIVNPGFMIAGTVQTDLGEWRAELVDPVRPLSITLETTLAADVVPISIRTRIGLSGRFEISGVPAGRYTLTANAGRRAGALRSATTGGVDVLDTGLRVDRDIKDVVLRFALSGTRVTGQMTTPSNRGPQCYAVAFSKDPAYWTFGSRRVAAALPDSLGRFELLNLPAGEYWLAAFNGAEPPSWTDAAFVGSLPRSASIVVTESARISRDLQCR